MATRRSTAYGPDAVVTEERPALAWGSTPIAVVVLAVVSAVLVLGHLFTEPMTRALASAAGESSLRAVSLGWASVAILPFSALLYGATVRDLRLPRGVRVVLLSCVALCSLPMIMHLTAGPPPPRLVIDGLPMPSAYLVRDALQLGISSGFLAVVPTLPIICTPLRPSADRARRPGEDRIPPWVLVGPSSRRWQWVLVISPVVGLAWAVWTR